MLKDETTESEKGEVVNEIEANADQDQGNNTGVVDHEDSGEDNANGSGVEDKLIDELLHIDHSFLPMSLDCDKH